MFLHRNSQKRFYGKDYIYFITTNTIDWLEYFREPLFCDLLIENLRLSKKIKCFELYAFCVLYDHVHLLLKPNNEYNISKVMQFIKRHFSRDMKFMLIEGGIRESRLRCGQYEKFTSIINAHDKNLIYHKYQFTNKYGSNQTKIPPFKWHESYHDHIIRGPRDFENHYNYTVYNYQKHGLPDDWPYTSLNYPDMIDDPPYGI